MTRAIERVMVVTAHPDDPEFGAGGTIATLVKDGREVTYVIVTNGRCSASSAWEFLGYEDGEVEDTRQLRLDITRHRHTGRGRRTRRVPSRTARRHSRALRNYQRPPREDPPKPREFPPPPPRAPPAKAFSTRS